MEKDYKSYKEEMESLKDFDKFEEEVLAFIKTQNEIIEVGGCLNYMAISILIGSCVEKFIIFNDIEIRHKIIKLKNKLIDLERKK